MASYLVKWFVASLIMPLMVLLLGKFLNQSLVLFFWPGSIVLMSLGAEKKPLFDIVYVWVIGICLNVILYLLIGLLFYFLLRYFKYGNF